MKRFGRAVLSAIIVAAFIALIGLVLVRFVDINVHDENIEAGYNSHQSATATFMNYDVTSFMNVKGSYDPNTVGEYELNYSVFLKEATQKISVKDTVSPAISIVGEKQVMVQDISEYVELGAKAQDTYDGDISNSIQTSSPIELEDGNYRVTYVVTDKAGNVGSCYRDIVLGNGVVYLTFDDGPSDLTPQVLDILNQYGVTATFFEINPSDLTQQENAIKVACSGNTLGLHGYSHDYSEIYSSIDSLMENFDTLHSVFEELCEYDAKFIRFPGGSSNTVSKKYTEGIMTEAVSRVAEAGYDYFDWNVDSNDAGSDVYDADAIYNNVITGIQGVGKTSVVLMHDSSGHEATVEALPKIIEWCLNNNYAVRAIDDSTPLVHHNVQN